MPQVVTAEQADRLQLLREFIRAIPDQYLPRYNRSLGFYTDGELQLRYDQGQCKIWIARDGKRVTSEVDIAPDDTAEIAREKLQQSLATN